MLQLMRPGLVAESPHFGELRFRLTRQIAARFLPPAINRRRELVRVQEALRISVNEPEHRGRSDRQWTKGICDERIVYDKWRIECQHALSALPNRMAVKHAIRTADD